MLTDTEILDFLQTFVDSEEQLKAGRALVTIEVLAEGPTKTLREALSEFALSGNYA